MRICLVSREFPPEWYIGGIGTYTFKTSAALARLGHEVHVITSSRKPEVEYTDSGVQVHRIQEPHAPKFIPQPLAHARAVFTAIAHIRGPLDIVQACEWGAEAFWYASMPGRRAPLVTRLATPLFMIRRMSDPEAQRRMRGWVTSWMERAQTQRSDGIISPTHALATIVCSEWGIDPNRATVVPTGASLGQGESVANTPVLEMLQGVEYLLYFGRLEARKGVHILGAALPAVLEAHPTLKAVFVGEDLVFNGQPMSAIVRGLAGDYAERVIFLPRMPQRDLFPIIRAARLVALPSLWENLANTCLEAMQLGRPVVATWGCGFEEVIEDGVSGFLAAPGDAAALALRIRAALDDEAYAERVGKAAKQRAKEFDIDVMAARLVTYYQRLIAQGGFRDGAIRSHDSALQMKQDTKRYVQ